MTTGNKDGPKCELAFTSYYSTAISKVNVQNNLGHHDLKPVDHGSFFQCQSSLTSNVSEHLHSCD